MQAIRQGMADSGHQGDDGAWRTPRLIDFSASHSTPFYYSGMHLLVVRPVHGRHRSLVCG